MDSRRPVASEEDMDSRRPVASEEDMDSRRPVASEEDIAKLFTEVLPYEEL